MIQPNEEQIIKPELNDFKDEGIFEVSQEQKIQAKEDAFINDLAIAIAAIAREIYANEIDASKESARKS